MGRARARTSSGNADVARLARCQLRSIYRIRGPLCLDVGHLGSSLSLSFENDDIADTTPLRIENRCPFARVKADRSKVKRRRVNLSPDDLERAHGVCVSHSMPCNVLLLRTNEITPLHIEGSVNASYTPIIDLVHFGAELFSCTLLLRSSKFPLWFFSRELYFLNILIAILRKYLKLIWNE